MKPSKYEVWVPVRIRFWNRLENQIEDQVWNEFRLESVHQVEAHVHQVEAQVSNQVQIQVRRQKP